MRKALRWRYYCEHCKKSGGSAGHMIRHETGCTANPNRECGVCRMAALSPQPLAVLVEYSRSHADWSRSSDEYPSGGLSKEHVEELRKLASGCPVCMFASLRQSNVYADKNHFDMKAELRDVWSEVNEHRMQQEYGYG